MQPVELGRELMADSLGFHILLALFGVGIPLLVCLAEFWGLYRRDADYLKLARRWSGIMAVLFASGAVSGIIISFQFTVLWGNFLSIASQVVGASFSLEGYAFFVEAIFLGIYLYSWDRLRDRPWLHWACSLPLVAGSAASAFFITTVNSFMNSPAGFTYVDGKVSDVHPWKAIFNLATPTETSHSLAAYYLTTSLCFAAVYAYVLLRRKTAASPLYKKAFGFLMLFSLLAALAVGLTGDRSARYVAHHEPRKFAAMEDIYTTGPEAPLWIDVFGHEVAIPKLLSMLSYGSEHATVTGLNDFDPNTWPPRAIHQLFDFMAVSGAVVVGVPALYLWLRRYRPASSLSRPMLWLILIAGPLAVLAVEFGWMVTELGRQPYAITGILTTAAAFSGSVTAVRFGFLFPLLFVMLLWATWLALRTLSRRESHD